MKTKHADMKYTLSKGAFTKSVLVQDRIQCSLRLYFCMHENDVFNQAPVIVNVRSCTLYYSSLKFPTVARNVGT
jgi:hypothetical protein